MPSKKLSYDATPAHVDYDYSPHMIPTVRQKVNPNYLL